MITFKFNKFNAVCDNFFKFNMQIVCHFLITTNIASIGKKHTILNLPSKMPIYAGKVCDMRTLLKYAEKNAAIL